MEARLLYPDGRRPSTVSPALGTVIPAVLPRLSLVELGMLGGIRGPVSPTVLPAGAPSELLVNQVRLRRALLRYYLNRLPTMDRVQRYGVDSLCDIASMLHLEPWIDPMVRVETVRPLRELIGPEDEQGFGPSYAEVLEVLRTIADVSRDERRTEALTEAWMSRRHYEWDQLADRMLSAANVTGRQVSLRMVSRVLAVTSSVVRRSVTYRAARLRAAAIILGDLLEEDLARAASEPWLAGIAAGPAAA